MTPRNAKADGDTPDCATDTSKTKRVGRETCPPARVHALGPRAGNAPVLPEPSGNATGAGVPEYQPGTVRRTAGLLGVMARLRLMPHGDRAWSQLRHRACTRTDPTGAGGPVSAPRPPRRSPLFEHRHVSPRVTRPVAFTLTSRSSARSAGLGPSLSGCPGCPGSSYLFSSCSGGG